MILPGATNVFINAMCKFEIEIEFEIEIDGRITYGKTGMFGRSISSCRPSRNSPGVSVTEFPMSGCAESRVAGPVPGLVQFAAAVRFPGRLRGR